MEYYFEVTFECWANESVLVKAKDVLEAGNKAAKMFTDRNGWCPDAAALLKEITKTKIFEVIE